VRRALFTTAAAVVVAAFGACTVSLQDPAGRACDEGHPCAGGRVCAGGFCALEGALEAGAADAGAQVDAGLDAAPQNLHPDGTFESGCGRWQAFNGTATPSSDAHGGSGACQVCGTGNFSLDDKGFLATPPDGRYEASAWVRPAPGAAPPTSWGILLRTVDQPDGGTFQEIQKSASTPPVATDWTLLSVDLDVTKPADVLNVVVFGSPSGCILVDDVSAERLP
jgi:hypothetical protein